MDDDDTPVVRIGAVKIRRARTDHSCDRCIRRISPGVKYQRQAFKVDGEMRATHVCILCPPL